MATLQQRLQIIIDAQNKTGGALSGVSKELDKVKKNVESFEPIFKKMAMVGTVAFAGFTTAIATSVSSANEAIKAQTQLEAVLKSTGNAVGLTTQDILDQASALQKMTTYNDEAILGAQNLLLTFTNVKGPIFQEAMGTILDMSTALGQDLKSSSIQVGKALQDPILGVSALRRVGVNFTEKQQEMIKTMVETGRVTEAQRYILKELATEFGGSASAQAKTFEGRLIQLKNRLDDMSEGIGRALIPVLEKIAEKIAPVVDKIITWIEQNPELTAKILIFGAVLSGIVATLGLLGMALPAIITGFQLMMGPIGLVALAITGLIAVGALIVSNWSTISETAVSVWNGIKDTIVGVVTGISDFMTSVWTGVTTFLQNTFYFLIGLFAMFMDTVFPGWQEKLQLIKDTWNTAWSGIMAYLQLVWDGIKLIAGAIGKAFTDMWNGVVGIFNWAKDEIKKAIEAIEGFVEPLFKILDSIINKIKSVGSAVSSFINKAISTGKSVVGARASGGPVSSGQGYLVGENGPEWFTPATAGRISNKGGGMTIVLQMSGNTFMGKEGIANQIAGELMKQLQLRTKLSY